MRIYTVEVDDSYSTEKEVHTFFAKHREAGEWFKSEHLDLYLEFITNTFNDNLLVHDDDNYTTEFSTTGQLNSLSR